MKFRKLQKMKALKLKKKKKKKLSVQIIFNKMKKKIVN